MQRVGSLASVYTGQPAGTPNCRPPKATFCAVLGLDVAGGVAGVEVVVLVEADQGGAPLEPDLALPEHGQALTLGVVIQARQIDQGLLPGRIGRCLDILDSEVAM